MNIFIVLCSYELFVTVNSEYDSNSSQIKLHIYYDNYHGSGIHVYIFTKQLFTCCICSMY